MVFSMFDTNKGLLVCLLRRKDEKDYGERIIVNRKGPGFPDHYIFTIIAAKADLTMTE